MKESSQKGETYTLSSGLFIHEGSSHFLFQYFAVVQNTCGSTASGFVFENNSVQLIQRHIFFPRWENESSDLFPVFSIKFSYYIQRETGSIGEFTGMG